MAELKTKENDASVDDFLNNIADEQRRKDSFELKKMFEDITGQPAKTWGSSIVGFGNHKLKYASGRELDWMITGFSPRKANLTLYVLDYENGRKELDELGPHKTGKGCLYIKQLDDVDRGALKKIISRSFEREKSV